MIYFKESDNFDGVIGISFIDNDIGFAVILTWSIRIIGLSGGISKDANNAYKGLQFYSSISELRVYED